MLMQFEIKGNDYANLDDIRSFCKTLSFFKFKVLYSMLC